MLNGETWLAHDRLLSHWSITQKNWARSLGWFSTLEQTLLKEKGWVITGPKNLTLDDYVSIVSAPRSEEKLYRYVNGVWEHINGPVVFVYKKSVDESFIAGWAGPHGLITECLIQSKNPWEWEGISVIEVIPESAVFTEQVLESSSFPVIFLSNGETNAEANWTRLLEVCPRAIRINGISGRRKAFRACAEAAGSASHFFVVTGKNYVIDPSIFSYQPENNGTHHIFHARNASNGLEYGHMGIGLYNSLTVRSTPEDFGLDFTAYGGITTVPIVASEARFATSRYEAWRTAFREVVKILQNPESYPEKYLVVWKNGALGPLAKDVMNGANDAVAFMEKYPEHVAKTVEWDWLETYYETGLVE